MASVEDRVGFLASESPLESLSRRCRERLILRRRLLVIGYAGLLVLQLWIHFRLALSGCRLELAWDLGKEFFLLLRRVTVRGKLQHSRSADSGFQAIAASRVDTHSRWYLWHPTKYPLFDFLASLDSSRSDLSANICLLHRLISFCFEIFAPAFPIAAPKRVLSRLDLFLDFSHLERLCGGFGHILTSAHG